MEYALQVKFGRKEKFRASRYNIKREKYRKRIRR